MSRLKLLGPGESLCRISHDATPILDLFSHRRRRRRIKVSITSYVNCAAKISLLVYLFLAANKQEEEEEDERALISD